jgi:hypothetical protein
MIAIVIASWLPTLGVILPVSSAYATNALVAGTLATLLAGFALVDDRARYGAAVLGAWSAFMPFIVVGTLLDIVLNLSWGVAMFTYLVGPFSAAPTVTFTKPLPVRTKEPEPARDLRTAA